MGVNAIHGAAEVLERLRGYEARRPGVDGLEFREGLRAGGISGGVAGNVVPGDCTVRVNYRFAPDRSEVEAEDHVREVFRGFDVTVTDTAPGARPGLEDAASQGFVAAIGGTPRAKFGWTDVARFAVLGVPAVNYGPGDPNVAHTAAEWVSEGQLAECEANLSRWLTS